LPMFRRVICSPLLIVSDLRLHDAQQTSLIFPRFHIHSKAASVQDAGPRPMPLTPAMRPSQHSRLLLPAVHVAHCERWRSHKHRSGWRTCRACCCMTGTSMVWPDSHLAPTFGSDVGKGKDSFLANACAIYSFTSPPPPPARHLLRSVKCRCLAACRRQACHQFLGSSN
jgi:hypothetical protein